MTRPQEPLELPAPGEGLAGRRLATLPGGAGLTPAQRAVVIFLGVVLLLLAALVTAPWGVLLLGAGAGVLVIRGVPAAVAALRASAALARAILPLLLPFLVFVAAGVVKSPPGLQFAVGLAVLLAAWFWLVRADWTQRRMPRPVTTKRWRTPLRLLAQVILPLAVVAAALLVLLASVIDVLVESEEWARTLFVLAVALLAGAAVLRILGYARTIVRSLVAIVLLLLLGRVAMGAGLLPGGILDEVEIRWYAVAAGALLLLASALDVLSAVLSRGAADVLAPLTAGESPAGAAAAGDPDDPPGLPWRFRLAGWIEAAGVARWITDRATYGGLLLALGSSALLLGAVFTASIAGGSDERTDRPVAGQPATRPAAISDRELAELFSPVLLFTEDQRWTPIAVDEYAAGATVTDWEGRKTAPAGIEDLPTTCPGIVNRPCYTLRQKCPEDEDVDEVEAAARCAEDLADDKAVYVRVARREQWQGCTADRPCADGSPNPFARVAWPHARDTEILVQYWYFYPYNEWVAPVAIGELEQIHPADWEVVTVGLSAVRPLWVAYSAHCAGTFADWGRIRVAPSDPQRLRPLVAVAAGSQANYRVAEESRVPNFAECNGIARDRLALASYAANIRDRTDDRVVWDPAPGDLRLVTAETPPMTFPGRWAPDSRMRLQTGHKALSLGNPDNGPASPTLQSLWQRPMKTIFGGRAWQEG